MSVHFDRANVLLEQSRHELAEKELRRGLAEDPNNARAHALLALCLIDREQFVAATDEASSAIQLDPTMSFGHYAMAYVLDRRNCFSEALAAIAEAIRLHPENAHYFAMLAEIHFDQRDWHRALDAAEMGLKIEAEHVGCNNQRAMALVKLGRNREAGQTLDAALARDPHNAETHVNMGWAHLEKRQPRQALEHFREALRLDPCMEAAKAGMVEGLKARFLIYRVLLAYFLWMDKLSRRMQWGLLIGGALGYLSARGLVGLYPSLGPWLWPLITAYYVFVMTSWFGVPLANLLLRLNRFGRLVLSPDQRGSSICVAICLLAGLGMLGWWLATDLAPMLLGALVMGMMAMPVSVIFMCDRGWPRTTMIACWLALALAGIGGAALFLIAIFTLNWLFVYLGNAAMTVFAVGFVCIQILGQAMAMVRVRR